MSWNENWKKGEDYPTWGNTDVYKKTISGGYLFDGESPREAYMRVSKTVARRLYKPEMAETFFEYIWNGWLCLASPVLSNTGTDRGLPISCFGIDVADSDLLQRVDRRAKLSRDHHGHRAGHAHLVATIAGAVDLVHCRPTGNAVGDEWAGQVR